MEYNNQEGLKRVTTEPGKCTGLRLVRGLGRLS
jgi:hypothetical protein